MKTIIHVNQRIVNANSNKHGAIEPVLTVMNCKETTYGYEAIIKGDSRVVYSPDKPLPSGAHVWIETQGEVIVLNDSETTLQEKNT